MTVHYSSHTESLTAMCGCNTWTLAGKGTDLYNVPDTARPIYFLSDREDSQAEFSIPPNMAETSVNAVVYVCGRKYLANKSSHSKTH